MSKRRLDIAPLFYKSLRTQLNYLIIGRSQESSHKPALALEGISCRALAS